MFEGASPQLAGQVGGQASDSTRKEGADSREVMGRLFVLTLTAGDTLTTGLSAQLSHNQAPN